MTKGISIPGETKCDSSRSRIDDVATVIALIGICWLGAVAFGAAVVELARLISGLRANPVDRGLMIAVVVASVWIIARLFALRGKSGSEHPPASEQSRTSSRK